MLNENDNVLMLGEIGCNKMRRTFLFIGYVINIQSILKYIRNNLLHLEKQKKQVIEGEGMKEKKKTE